MRFTKLAQNGEGEKTVGERQHTHSQTITIFTAPTHAQYTCTANILRFGNHYSEHSMMTIALYMAILDSSQVLFCHGFETTTAI